MVAEEVAYASMGNAEAHHGMVAAAHPPAVLVGLVEATGTVFGGYQAILRDPVAGVYFGASEWRKDALALGYERSGGRRQPPCGNVRKLTSQAQAFSCPRGVPGKSGPGHRQAENAPVQKEGTARRLAFQRRL